MNGAWKCHGCGARGGAFDAALAKGSHPRAAIDLMIAYGLAERRGRLRRPPGNCSTQPRHPPATLARADHDATVARRTLQVTDRDIARWETALSRRPRLLARLANERGWRYETMRSLELGIDRGRITIPIRNATGQLRGVHRYQPDHTARPKMLAARGSRLGLVPHPAVEMSEPSPSRGGATRHDRRPFPRSAGDRRPRRPRMATALGAAPGRARVTIVMDADTQGRAAARRIAADLAVTSRTRRSSTSLRSATMDTTSPTGFLSTHR